MLQCSIRPARAIVLYCIVVNGAILLCISKCCDNFLESGARRAEGVNTKIKNIVQVFLTREFRRLAGPKIIYQFVITTYFPTDTAGGSNHHRVQRGPVMRLWRCCNAQYHIASQYGCPLIVNHHVWAQCLPIRSAWSPSSLLGGETERFGVRFFHA